MTQWLGKGQDLSIFRFAAHDGIQAAMVVEEVINRKFTKVAILHDATNYGVSGRDDLQREIKKQGDKLQVVAKTSGPINAIMLDQAHGTMWGGSSDHGEDYGIGW